MQERGRQLQWERMGNGEMPKAIFARENRSKAFPRHERGAAFATVTALKKCQSQERKKVTRASNWPPADAATCAVCARGHGDNARLVKHLRAAPQLQARAALQGPCPATGRGGESRSKSTSDSS